MLDADVCQSHPSPTIQTRTPAPCFCHSFYTFILYCWGKCKSWILHVTEGKQKAEAKIGSHRTLRFSQRACFSEKLGLIPLEHRFKKKKTFIQTSRTLIFLYACWVFCAYFSEYWHFKTSPQIFENTVNGCINPNLDFNILCPVFTYSILPARYPGSSCPFLTSCPQTTDSLNAQWPLGEKKYLDSESIQLF